MTSNQPLPDSAGLSSRLHAPTAPVNERLMLFALVLAFFAFYLLPLMSHGLWTRRFGADPSVVGRLIDLGGGIEPEPAPRHGGDKDQDGHDEKAPKRAPARRNGNIRHMASL